MPSLKIYEENAIKNDALSIINNKTGIEIRVDVNYLEPRVLQQSGLQGES